MDTDWLVVGVILYSVVYAWLCFAPDEDEHALPNIAPQPSPLQSSSSHVVSSELDP